MRRIVSMVTLVACAVGAVTAWGLLGRPQALPDAPAERAACVSYAPFQGNETPFDRSFVIPRQRVEDDLKALSRFTGCVRTYATTNGLDQVPAAAEKAGMTVLQGIWIGRQDEENETEIARGVALARQFPNTVSGVIVGNEALLRREITASRLAALIGRVKEQVAQPVTYADVWEFWEKNPELAPAVDFITIHLLPYWEDQPADIGRAVPHVAATLEHMEQVFPGRKLLIGEIGWPSAGRQREGAEATLYNETRFIREVMTAAEKKGWNYNLIESFDQPWKRALEGTAGGAWGLFTDDRQPKVTLQGPVVELPSWRLWLGGGAVAGALLALFALLSGRRPDAAGTAIACAGGLAAGEALSFFALHMSVASRTPLEWAVNGIVLLLMAVSAACLLRVLRAGEARAHDDLLAWCRRGALVVGAVSMLGHVFDARYRDFPTSMLAIAAVGFALLRFQQRGHTPLRAAREDLWLAVVIALGVPVVVFNEGWRNGDALVWAATAGLLALSLWPGRSDRYA